MNEIEVGICDICKRFTVRSNVLLVHPPNTYSSHFEALRCEENSKNICFSCKLRLKERKFFLKFLIQLYKEKGLDDIRKLQDLAIICNSSRLMDLFEFEENIKKIDLNRDRAIKTLKRSLKKVKTIKDENET